METRRSLRAGVKEASMDGMQTPILPGGLMGHWDHVTDADWAEVLAAFPLFTGVAKRKLRKLVRHSTFAEYGVSDIVIEKGALGDSLYVILGGSARARGKPAARTLRVGDFFGELGLLDGVPRSATVVAISELQVMKLPRQSFLKLVQHEPAISLQMVSNLGGQIRRLETRAAQT
jgi:CRP/FNR family transcriptional regulator, cyclic AMP receptor protein